MTSGSVPVIIFSPDGDRTNPGRYPRARVRFRNPFHLEALGREESRSLRPASESTLSAPASRKDETAPPTGETAEQSAAKPYWRPLEALLRLRALEALRHREFRLLWYGQIFSSMATWMDSIARGWLIY